MNTQTFQVEFANTGGVSWLAGFANELAIGDDGWMMVAPYGDHPSEALIPQPDGRLKKQRAIQRINKSGAEKMVAEFHNSRVGLKKFLVGKMIYVGHPDVPGLENKYPDAKPKGLYSDFEARGDGLYGKPVFNNDGAELIAQKKFRAVSGRFGESMRDGEVNGLPVYCPTEILSVGLTNHPHLPVHFFNSDDTLADAEPGRAEKPTPTMKKKLIEICTALGIQFANDADDATTEAALDAVKTKVAEFANEKQSLTAKVSALETEKNKLTADLTAAQTQRDAAQTEFANERTARVNELISHGLSGGVITGMEEADWRRRLGDKAQFANEVAAFAKLQPKVKTKSVLFNHGGRDRQVDTSNPRERAQFANEVMRDISSELKLNPVTQRRQIYNEAQRRFPALFEGLKQVKIVR